MIFFFTALTNSRSLTMTERESIRNDSSTAVNLPIQKGFQTGRLSRIMILDMTFSN